VLPTQGTASLVNPWHPITQPQHPWSLPTSLQEAFGAVGGGRKNYIIENIVNMKFPKINFLKKNLANF
jgi:hypothetical protein